MASTIAFYTGDGTTTDFTVPFDYLKKSFVTVRLGAGTTLTGGDYGDTGSDYYFLDKTTIRLKVAPSSGESLTIRRYTSATERVVTFKDASILKATDLDTSQVQAFHIAEEGRDILEDSLSVNREGNWDAKGKRIINVGDAVSDGDAVNLKLYKEDAKGAYQSKLDAERARDRAVEAETNAKESEANAKLSEVTAQASAGTAVSASKHADAVKVENQAILQEAKEIRDENKVLDANTKNNANVAQVKANEAKVSETNAKKSEVNSKASEVEAKRQADLAKDYANQAASGQMNADWNETVSTSKAFIKNKPTLGSLASKDSIAYSEITGTPPEPDLSGLATKNELQTGLASKANSSHTHTKSQITDFPTIPDAILKNGNRGAIAGYEQWTKAGATTTLNVSSGDSLLMETAGAAATINVQAGSIGQVATKLVWVALSNKSITINGITGWFGEAAPTLNKSSAVLLFFFHDMYTECRLIDQWDEP